ncbi:MAG: radical SAM protein [Planctomycetota bacterium]
MKLGLIALSGVRVLDPELLALGQTLPGFAERGRTIAALPSLGLLTLAGLVPAEFDVRYVEVDELPHDLGELGDFDVVALSFVTARARAAYVLADRFRAIGVRVVMGGLHVTAVPDEALDHADAIVLGEAEAVWPALLHDLQRGTLRARYDGRKVAFDLADAPLPRFELLEGRAVARYTVQTQRGCPWDCEFCAASIRLRPGLRVKPAQKIRAEVRAIQALAPRPFLELADDNTFASPAHGRRVCDALAPLGLRWFTETDVSFGDDEDLIARAADAGCVQVLIGLESPSARALDGVERTRDWKATQAGRYLDAIERIQRRGIAVNGCFVLGLDGAGPEQFDATLDFVRDSGLQEVQVTVQTAFPGAPLYDRLAREGRLLAPDAWERCTLFDVSFAPVGVTVEELRAGLHRLTAALYAPDAVAERRARFRAARRGPAARG